MKKLLVIGISAVLMITLTAGLFAESLLGRDLVSPENKTTVSGTLVYDDGEWYLKSGGDLIQIHLGNQAYLDSIGLEPVAGEEAVVFGFRQGNDISPITVTLGSAEYRLRDESGFPLWAGAGERRNAAENDRRGGGRNQAARSQGFRALDGRGQGPNAVGARLQSCDCSEEG